MFYIMAQFLIYGKPFLRFKIKFFVHIMFSLNLNIKEDNMYKRIDELKLKKLFRSDIKFQTISQIQKAYTDTYKEDIEYPTLARTLRKLYIVKRDGYYQNFGVPIEHIQQEETNARFNLSLMSNKLYPEYDSILIKSEQKSFTVIDNLKKIPEYINNTISTISIDNHTIMVICSKNSKKKVIDYLKEFIPISTE